MSLLEKASIFKMYLKSKKKSILLDNNKDLFLVCVIVILLAVPLIIKLSSKKESVTVTANPVILNLSVNIERLFGSELSEILIKEFEERNSGIKLKITNDTEPDIVFFAEGSFSALTSAGVLADLSAFSAGTGENAPRFAVPLVSFMDLLFYNIDILSAAGFDRPPGTRNEFTAYARAVVSSENSDAAGVGISLSRDDRRSLSRDIFSWIWAGGGNFWSEDGELSLNTRAVTADLTFLGTLFSEKLTAPRIFETTGTQRLEQFAAGKIAMMIASAQAIPFLRERLGDSAFGITTIPVSGTGGNYSVNLSSIYTAISANSGYKEDAWSFIEFIREKHPLLCAKLKAVPGSGTNIIPGDYVTDDLFYSKAWDIFESAKIAEGFSGKPGAEEYKAVFLDELINFYEESKTAAQAVTSIEERWAEIQQ